jgi:hypothetical protein
MECLPSPRTLVYHLPGPYNQEGVGVRASDFKEPRTFKQLLNPASRRTTTSGVVHQPARRVSMGTEEFGNDRQSFRESTNS